MSSETETVKLPREDIQKLASSISEILKEAGTLEAGKKAAEDEVEQLRQTNKVLLEKVASSDNAKETITKVANNVISKLVDDGLITESTREKLAASVRENPEVTFENMMGTILASAASVPSAGEAIDKVAGTNKRTNSRFPTADPHGDWDFLNK
jgi:hypothetical protein